jgi:hypothetical protein
MASRDEIKNILCPLISVFSNMPNPHRKHFYFIFNSLEIIMKWGI